MFSLCRARHAVKVLSASLMESLPLTGTDRTAPIHRATLTFHLHRSSPNEPYGVACAFGVLGDFDDLCFIRSVTPDLAASSTVLSGLLQQGKPASTEALRLLSLNGEINPNEERVKALMTKGRDAVFQCAVSTAAVDATLLAEGGSMTTEALTKEDAEESSAHDSAEDAAVQEETTKPKRRGRPPAARGGSRRVLKRAQNKGHRAAVDDVQNQDSHASSPANMEDALDAAALDESAVEESAVAAEVSAKVMEALEALPVESSKQTKPKRHRRTKAEMAAARLQAAAMAEAAEAEEGEDAVTEDAAPAAEAVRGSDGDEEQAWFRRTKETDVAGEEGEEAEENVVPKRRSRRSSKAETGDTETQGTEDEAAIEGAPAKGKRGRKAKGASKAVKARRTRKAEATSEDDTETENTLAATQVHAGVDDEEEMAF